MSSQESFDELEPKITGLVEEAIREVREEFLRRLQETRLVLDELLGETATPEPGSTADQGIVETERAEPVEPAAPPMDLLPGLHTAVARLDRCRTQNELLSSLVESTGVFASRAGLFLTREEGLHGWTSVGFAEGGEDFETLVLEYHEGSPWGRLAEGRGVIELDAHECAELCSGIDNSSPLSGVIVPIVLRDRLAAALYADQMEDDESVGLPALQLLAYVAAQALETLPLRERSSTATLRLATEAPFGEPALSLWQFAVAEPEVSIVEEIGEMEEPAIEEEAEDLYAVETTEKALEDEDVEVEAVGVEEAEEAYEEVAEEEAEIAAAEAEAEEAYEEVAEEEAEIAAAEQEVRDFEIVEQIPEGEVEIAAEADLQPAEETGFEVEAATEEAWAAPEVEVEEPAEQEPVLEVAEEEAEIEAPPEEPEVESEPAPAVMEGAEVRPPEDAQGPGWAFTTNRFSSEGGGEAVHEEARRLARLLVTEIKLYNEEQVEAGRRNRNIYEVLREDIDRSRQIYEERIDDSVRGDADYFHDELVRILAAGESEILGL